MSESLASLLSELQGLGFLEGRSTEDCGEKAQAIGIKNLDVLQQNLARKPWRRLFLLFTDDPEQPDGYQLCVGSQCLEVEFDPATLVAKL